jgi:predicted nucleotidyltransferase
MLEWAQMPNLLECERLAVGEFCATLREQFGVRMRELALFGSRARDEGDHDSDIDVLVVVDDLTGAEGRAVAHLAGDMLTWHDVLLSPFAVSAAVMAELRAREGRLASEIARDAVAL